MALVVWLAVGGHLTGLAHFALVSHHVCAAHGELTHGEHAHAAVGHGAATNGKPAADAAANDDDGEHEHCSVLARRHEAATLARASSALVLPAPRQLADDARPEAAPRHGDDLLTLAPKTSPPV